MIALYEDMLNPDVADGGSWGNAVVYSYTIKEL